MHITYRGKYYIALPIVRLKKKAIFTEIRIDFRYIPQKRAGLGRRDSITGLMNNWAQLSCSKVSFICDIARNK